MNADLAAIVSEMRDPSKLHGVTAARVRKWADRIESALHSQAQERDGWVLDGHSAGRLADYMMRRGGPCQSYNREAAIAKAVEFLKAAAPTGGSEK